MKTSSPRSPSTETGLLAMDESRRLAAELGVRLPEQVLLDSLARLDEAVAAAASRLSGPRAVIKALGPELEHKTEAGAVRVVASEPAALASELRGMAGDLGDLGWEQLVIEEFVAHDESVGGEILLSIRWTDDFGAVVTLGIGGVATELLSRMLQPELRTLMVGAGEGDATFVDELLEGHPLVPLLTGGFRGQEPRWSQRRLRELLLTALDVGARRMPGTMVELEINPLVVVDGEPVALDVTARSGPAPRGSLPRPVERIDRLLHPETVAVMGVSRRLNPGHVIVNNLLDHGFPRDRIHVIKPGVDEIEGCACVDRVADLPEPVDLLVLAVAAEQVPGAIREVVEHRAAESLIVIPGGLGERSGTVGLAASVRETLDRSRDSSWGGPVVNGGNCLGARSIPGRYDTMFLPPHKVAPARRPDTPLAIVSQSGAFLVAKASRLLELSPRYLISIGNQIDLTAGDYARFLAADTTLAAHAYYVEGFRPGDGRRWLEAASEIVASGRPVVLYRAGRTAAGARASASHTAAIAGDAAVTRSLAATAGVLVADSLADFEDLVAVSCMLRDRTVSGNRLGAMSNAGFETVALADSLDGMELPRLGDDARRRLGEILEPRRLDTLVAPENPLDVNPMMEDAGFVATAEALLSDESVDVGVIGCVPLTGALQTLAAGPGHDEDIEDPDSVASRLCDLWDRSTKAWVAVVDGGPTYDALAWHLRRHGIPTFRSADRALRILGRYCAWARRYRRDRG